MTYSRHTQFFRVGLVVLAVCALVVALTWAGERGAPREVPAAQLKAEATHHAGR